MLIANLRGQVLFLQKLPEYIARHMPSSNKKNSWPLLMNIWKLFGHPHDFYYSKIAAQSPVASAVKELVETECKSYSDHATQSKQSKFIRT